MSTKQVRISEDSLEKLEELQESSIGEPSYRSLVDEAIAAYANQGE